jgi:hypothetical protein
LNLIRHSFYYESRRTSETGLENMRDFVRDLLEKIDSDIKEAIDLGQEYDLKIVLYKLEMLKQKILIEWLQNHMEPLGDASSHEPDFKDKEVTKARLETIHGILQNFHNIKQYRLKAQAACLLSQAALGFYEADTPNPR